MFDACDRVIYWWGRCRRLYVRNCNASLPKTPSIMLYLVDPRRISQTHPFLSPFPPNRCLSSHLSLSSGPSCSFPISYISVLRRRHSRALSFSLLSTVISKNSLNGLYTTRIHSNHQSSFLIFDFGEHSAESQEWGFEKLAKSNGRKHKYATDQKPLKGRRTLSKTED